MLDVSTEVGTRFAWKQIGCFHPPPDGARSTVLDPTNPASDFKLAVYRLDFLMANNSLRDGAIDDGNTYVGETTNLSSRLSTYRFGGGVHAVSMRQRIRDHVCAGAGDSVGIFVIDESAEASVGGVVVSRLPVGAGSQGAMAGHIRTLFEQSAILATGNEPGRVLINVAPELRHLLAASARAVKAAAKKAIP